MYNSLVENVQQSLIKIINMKKISLEEYTIAELKKMVLDNLTTSMPYGEASKHVNKATLSVKGDQLTVIYENGEKDFFTTEVILILKKQ